jgi:Peptidase family M50.
MKRSGIYLGSIAGTTITLELSFLVLIGLFVLLDLENRVGGSQALLWIPVIFFGVLLHELGHATAIGAFGYGPSEITLAGFGGLTVNARRAKAWHDMVISVAGPLTSIALAGVAWGTPYILTRVHDDPFFRAILPMTVQANVLWGIFNLFPVIPLDGGQAFLNFMRLLVAPRTAVMVTIWISFILGAAMLAVSLYLRWFFVVIIAAMLLMQNVERYRMLRRPPPSDDDGPP